MKSLIFARTGQAAIATVVLLLSVTSMWAQDTPAEFHASEARLEAYIREALERNPSVRSAFARYQAGLQRLPQAGSLPDPMLGFTGFVRSPETRVGPQTSTLSISQQFPWFGKLGDRERIAAKEAFIQSWSYETQRDETIRQVKIAYYDLAYLDRALQITGEDLSVLQHYEILAQARYAQGIGLQQGVVKLQAEITRARNRLAHLESLRVEAEAALNALRDRPASSPVDTVSLQPGPAVTVDLEELYTQGRENRPEVQAALAGIERDENRIELARKSYRPDITIGAAMTNVHSRSDVAGLLMPPDQNGKNIFSFTIGINIPLRRGKYDAAVAEATEQKLGSREEYRGTVNTVEASVRAIGYRIETLGEQIALFEHTLQPQAEQALRSSEAAYATGTLGVLDLLDSERILLEVRLGLARLTSDYLKALAEMERAIGAPFPEATP